MTNQTSALPLKKTKIVATIGPASSTLPVLKNMIKAGMDVARFNFSHGSHESNLKLVETVRQASTAVKLPVAILLDLQGPKVRIGELPQEGLRLQEGQTVTLHAGVLKTEAGLIPVPYKQLATDIKVGDHILLDDGTKELEVTKVKVPYVEAKVLLGGTVLSKKGINVPSVTLVKDALTKKDLEDLEFGLQHGIDFVALSFVREAKDVKKLQDKIKQYLPKDKPTPAIIVKVEKPQALDNFDEILAATDGIMIARGDLGLETPISSVPLRQKEMIMKCLAAAKPVITATEMLGSMQFNPRPTRAEVSDVANAVLDHTDAVMLSGESAMGRHPVRAIQMMAEIAQVTENSSLAMPPLLYSDDTTDALTVAEDIVSLAEKLSAQAIIVSGQTTYPARAISRLRPNLPIIAVVHEQYLYQQLILSRGVTPLLVSATAKPAEILKNAIKQLQKQTTVAKDQAVIQVSDLDTDHSTIVVARV